MAGRALTWYVGSLVTRCYAIGLLPRAPEDLSRDVVATCPAPPPARFPCGLCRRTGPNRLSWPSTVPPGTARLRWHRLAPRTPSREAHRPGHSSESTPAAREWRQRCGPPG